MTKRLFIAVEISAEARAAGADLMNQLETDFPTAKVKWERPEKLHLTLRFLGTVEAGQVGSIQNAARNTAARCSPFNIELFGTGAFPNVKRPRVIWIGVRNGHAELVELAGKLDEYLPEVFPSEARAYSPHCTLGRVKASETAIELAKELKDRPFGPVSWVANEIVIFESTLLPSGSVYSPIYRIPLLLS